MKTRCVTVLLALCVVSAAGAPPLRHRDDTVLVKPKKAVPPSRIEREHRRLNARAQHTFRGIGNLQIVKLPPGLSVQDALERYERSGAFEYAEPDYMVWADSVSTGEYCQASAAANDPDFLNGLLWGLHNHAQSGGLCGADLDAPEAWQTRTDAGNFIVGVIDTGIRYTHEDLAANLWTNPGEIPANGLDDDGNGVVDDVHGAKFMNGIVTGDPWDDHFHGTHVAGTILGRGNNGVGVAGVAWSGKLMALKFLGANGSGYVSDAVLATDYARRMGARVLNNSWGGGGYSQALFDAILATRDANMIFVASAGNDASDNDFVAKYPASYNSDNIVAVAATDRRDELAGFSNFGASTVELGAPGVDTWSCNNLSDQSYRYASGTSMASPHVSGACALLWAQYPGMSYADIVDRLLLGVDYVDSLQGLTITGGRLNLHRSLEDPVADFHATIVRGAVPLTVTFTDRSLAWTSPVVSRLLDFGDGTVTSDPVVTHTYTNPGTYRAVLRVENAAGQFSTKVRTITPFVANPVMAVTPAEGFLTSGPHGGPFYEWKEYWIENTGVSTLDWQVSPEVAWAYVDTPSGSLEPGMMTSVLVGIGGTAYSLPPGQYGGALNFINPFNGQGNAQRWLQLTVTAPGALVVSPSEPVAFEGYQGGPFSPAAHVFTVQNVSSNFTLEFSAVGNADWQTVEPESGILGPGQSTQVVVSVNTNAAHLVAGTYTESVGFNNNTTGEYLGDRETRLTVHSLLDVSPAGLLVSSGPVGGPFTPGGVTYTLQWLGPTPLEWVAVPVDDWFTVTPESGTLQPFESVDVSVTYNAWAEILPEGVWESGISFYGDQLDTYVHRFTQLIVGQGQLFVTPYQEFSASGPQGGPFSPASKTYRLQWVGVTDVEWAANFGHGWLAASPASGTLASGQALDVVVSHQAASLVPGSYASSITFLNAPRNLPYATFPAHLTVTQAGTLTVQPDEPVLREGPAGGPFASKTYTLRNNTAYPLNWTASASEPWIDLLSTSGTLAPGAFAYVVVRFDGAARSLPVGQHTGTVSFDNASNGSGSTARDVVLTVVQPGALSVTPSEGMTSTGPQGGPFVPASKSYTLTNTGGWPINWSLGIGVSWLTATPVMGVLQPGSSTNVTVSVASNSFGPGTWNTTVGFINSSNGNGSHWKPFSLVVTPPGGVLTVSPSGGLSSSGFQGGPFSPASQTYTLSNTGGATLDWSASKSAAWVSLSPASGSLGVGAATTVTVSINTNANLLSGGTHADTVNFVNTSNGSGTTSRPVSLSVTPVVLNAPGSLTATQVTGPGVRLTWTDTSTNETGFAIERAVKSGSSWGAFTQVGTVGADVTSYTNAGVSKKKIYRYRVRAYRGTLYGPYSSVVEITIR